MSTGPDAERDADEAGQNVAAQGGIVSAMTMLSRISGLVRDMVLSYFFGATNVADAFFVAFRLPNLFRRLLGGAWNGMPPGNVSRRRSSGTPLRSPGSCSRS